MLLTCVVIAMMSRDFHPLLARIVDGRQATIVLELFEVCSASSLVIAGSIMVRRK